jgi:hypothetical protein
MEACMTMLSLLTSTGDDRADAILRGAVSLWEAVFPERIRGTISAEVTPMPPPRRPAI